LRAGNRVLRTAILGCGGDVKFLSGIGELRIDYGPGYRLYFAKRNDVLVILLRGSDKSDQDRGSKWAIRMAEEF
jgi:putative addiction module killer protein